MSAIFTPFSVRLTSPLLCKCSLCSVIRVKSIKIKPLLFIYLLLSLAPAYCFFSPVLDGLRLKASALDRASDVGQGLMDGWVTGMRFGSVCFVLAGLTQYKGQFSACGWLG